MSPVEDPTLRWLLAAIFSALGLIFIWIYHHSVRDAKREVKVDEIAKELGDAGTKGTVLFRQHWASKWIRKILEALGMEHEE